MKLWFYIVLVFASLNAVGQGRVWVTNSSLPDTLVPGSNFTLVFKINIYQENIDSVKGVLIIPEDWKLFSEKRIEAEDKSNVKYFYSILTKEDVRAGYQNVKFEAYVSDRLRGFKNSDIKVKEKRKIDILAVVSPEYVKEGEILLLEYLVQNLGNRMEKVSFFTDYGEVVDKPNEVDLQPNESIRIKTRQEIPVTGNESWYASCNLNVLAKGLKSPFQQFSLVRVFPSKTFKTETYRKIPLELGVRYLSFSMGNVPRQDGFQYFFNSYGSLDEGKKHNIDINIKGPNQQMFPAVGTYDHYSAGYSFNNKFIAIAGDFNLSFNNLMEFGRYGRGGYAEGKFGHFGAKAFIQNARFFASQKHSTGAEFSYSTKSNLRLAAAYFSKEVFENQKWMRSELVGLSSFYGGKSFRLETEIAGGKAEEGKFDGAFFNRLTFIKNRFSFTNNTIYAGKKFYGFYNNSRFSITNLSYNVTSALSTGIMHNYSLINPSLDATVFMITPFSHSFMAFVSYVINRKHAVWLNYTLGERRDRQAVSTYDFFERYGNVNYAYTGLNFKLVSQFRSGSTHNNLASLENVNSKSTYLNGSLEPSYRVLKHVWVGALGQYQRTSRFSITDKMENLFFYGGNIRADFSRYVNLFFTYRNSYAPDELLSTRSFLDLALTVDLRNHRLGISGGRVFIPNQTAMNENTMYFAINYSIKLNAPFRRNNNTGQVKGTVKGLGPDVRRDGLLIRMGGREFITDHTGSFAFEGLKEDKYQLSLQHTNPHLGIIPLQKQAHEILVKRDSVSYLDIELVKSGSLEGKVEFENPSESRQKPVVLVRLSNSEHTYLTELRSNGEFSFKEILPGSWRVEAFLPGENPNFEIEVPDRNIEIDPNKLQRVTFKVRAKERKIFFVNKDFQLTFKQ